MKIKTWFIAGIIGIGVIAGVFEALSSPRNKEAAEQKKEEEKTKALEDGNCDGL
jgi:hypothetical protein